VTEGGGPKRLRTGKKNKGGRKWERRGVEAEAEKERRGDGRGRRKRDKTRGRGRDKPGENSGKGEKERNWPRGRGKREDGKERRPKGIGQGGKPKRRGAMSAGVRNDTPRTEAEGGPETGGGGLGVVTEGRRPEGAVRRGAHTGTQARVAKGRSRAKRGPGVGEDVTPHGQAGPKAR